MVLSIPVTTQVSGDGPLAITVAPAEIEEETWSFTLMQVTEISNDPAKMAFPVGVLRTKVSPRHAAVITTVVVNEMNGV